MSHAKPARSYFALSPEEKAALVQFQIADPLLATSRCLAACSKGVKAWEEEVNAFGPGKGKKGGPEGKCKGQGKVGDANAV